MRKSLILTSILALAACSNGGGEHNPGHAHGAASTPTVSSGTTFTSGIYTNTETNGEVTQMKTQVIVDSGGNVITPHLPRGGSIRSGSIQDVNGNSYNMYDLSDVKLYIADEELDSENPAFLKIGLADDGKIENIILASGGTEAELSRKDNTNHFLGPIFEYVLDGQDKAKYRVVDNGQTMEDLATLATEHNLTGGHWNLVDERMTVTTNKHITQNNPNAPVLQYSDFGHFNPVYRSKHTELNAEVLAAIRQYGAQIDTLLDEGDDEALATLLETAGLDRENKDQYRNDDEFNAELEKEDYQLFAGGYAIGADGNPIEGGSFDAPRGATFTGTGVGRVYTSIKPNTDGTEQEYKDALLAQYDITGDGHDISKSFTTSSAQLDIDASGNQTLVMNFPDFYRVTATKIAGGVEHVELDKPDGVTIENQYMRTGDVALPDYMEERYQVTSNGTQGDPEEMFRPGYYGVGSASEAAGFVRYAQDTGDIAVTDTNTETTKTFTREFEFQGAYGMTKNN